MEIAIVGGGIGGLTLALRCTRSAIAVPRLRGGAAWKPLGVGINLLPHAMRELTELGLGAALERVAVATQEVVFCNRFGQFIRREPRGRAAGYAWPQLSIHRADLHAVLLAAVHERLGADAVATGRKVHGHCAGRRRRRRCACDDGEPTRARRAAIGCDGIHSVVRKLLHPDEGPLSYQGINMWRGVTRAKPFLTGASMVIGGWLEVGKLVVYPMRNAIDGEGRQLLNWVAEIQSPRNVMQDWNLDGHAAGFPADVRGLALRLARLRGAAARAPTAVLEYPMVDREPLPFWTRGRVTLLGDAAHPMYPRGSNGAGQAILDARTLAGCLKRERDVPAALAAYEAARLASAYEVVLANRASGPDALLAEVHRRTGDRPFARIEDVMSEAEMRELAENYQRIAGFEREALERRASLA